MITQLEKNRDHWKHKIQSDSVEEDYSCAGSFTEGGIFVSAMRISYGEVWVCLRRYQRRLVVIYIFLCLQDHPFDLTYSSRMMKSNSRENFHPDGIILTEIREEDSLHGAQNGNRPEEKGPQKVNTCHGCSHRKCSIQ